MNTKEITKIISDDDLSSVRNVFYGSQWIDKTEGEDNKLSKSYLNISEKCNALDYAADGIISEDSSDYNIYKNSQFYQESNPSNNLNAFLWYYSTGRLDDLGLSNIDPKVLNQMKNTACQILQKKAVSIDYSNSNSNTPVCNDKIIGCSVQNILSNDSSNKTILISIFIISIILFAFGIISLINLTFKILQSFNKLNNGSHVQDIIISILVFIGVAIGLIYFYKYSISTTSTALSNEYVFIPPDMNDQDSSSESTSESPEYGCANTKNGCCNYPNNTTAKIDENGSNCVQQTDSNIDLSTIIWFIVLFVLSLIFYILFIISDIKILFWCFIICCLLSLNFIFGNIKISDNINLVVQKQINTNINILMNTSNFINKYIEVILVISIISIIIFLFILFFLFNTSRSIFEVFYIISKTLLSLSFVILIFSVFMIWYNYPLLFCIIIFLWRFLINNILSYVPLNMFSINLNSFLYEQPMQYFVNLYLYNIPNDFINYFTKEQLQKVALADIDLPSGLPWDIPVITIIKIVLLIIIKLYNKQNPNTQNNIFDTFNITENKYAASNINVFSIFSFFGKIF